MKMSRAWAMPNAETFSIPPIRDFIARWLRPDMISVDPFARSSKLATVTNDLNPNTSAQYHMDAEDFLRSLQGRYVDLVLFDPPYPPRQISECYQSVGREVGMKGTQNSALYRRVRDAAHDLLPPLNLVLSFGWNSNGMGQTRGYRIEEIMIVAHGGGHNDTICMAERKMP